MMFWDVVSGKHLRTIRSGAGNLDTVAFSRDGRTLASGAGFGVQIWDIATGHELRPLLEPEHNSERISSVSFSPDGRWIASCGSGGKLQLWSSTIRRMRCSIRLAPEDTDINQVAFSPSSRYVAAANANGTIYILRPAAESPIPKDRDPIAEKLASRSLPKDARISLTPLKSAWFLGENILLRYEVKNVGDEAFNVDSGGGFRSWGGGRESGFQVVAINEAGVSNVEPMPDPETSGSGATIQPDEHWIELVPLMRYRNLQQPGRYTIRVANGLGWGKQGKFPNVSVPIEQDDPRWA